MRDTNEKHPDHRTLAVSSIVLLNESLNHAFGPGHGWSFWQVRVRDTDGKLSDALRPKWGGLGKPGAKERALEQLKGLGEA
jgi:hypothetical protein